ncbi:gp53-like domain-containing protein [Morganella morganii]
MSVMNKPDYKIFAQDAKSGEYVAFPDILRGWGITLEQYGGFPPMELFNSAAKRIDEWLLYLTQRGLPEWDAVVDYPKDAMIQHAGIYYVSLKATKGEQPNNSQASWKKLTEILGVDGKLAKDQNGADIPNKPKFIENLRLSELFADKKRFDANGSFTLMFSEDRKFSLQLGNNGYLSLYNLTLDKSVMTWSPSGELVSGDIGFDRVKDLKSAAKRDVGNGAGQIPDMSFFPLSGIGTDNLIATFPNGLIIQVFKRTLANKAAAGEIETIPLSYPMAFPRGAAAVFCTKTSYAQTLVSCENATATDFSAVTVKVFESAGATLSTANFLAIGWQ